MILQRAYNDGHLIGMTYRAPGDSSEGLTDQQIRDDVTNTAKVIETLIGVAPKYIRLHYSQPEDTRLENIVRDMGYTLIYYNLDTQDYNYKNNPKGLAELYKSTFEKQLDTYDSKGSFISVQYDIPDTGSWQAIYDTINEIDKAGYTMVRLDGCLNDKKPYKKCKYGVGMEIDEVAHAHDNFTAATSKEFVSDKHSLGASSYKQGQKMVDEPPQVTSDKKSDDAVNEDKELQENEAVSWSSWSSWISTACFAIIMCLLA